MIPGWRGAGRRQDGQGRNRGGGLPSSTDPAARDHPEDVVDAGLQSERTYLAWQRTGLSFAAVGALLIHAAGGVRHPLADIPGLAALAVGAVILLRAVLRYRSIVAAARAGRSATSAPLAAAVAGAAAAAGLSGLLIALTTVG